MAGKAKPETADKKKTGIKNKRKSTAGSLKSVKKALTMRDALISSIGDGMIVVDQYGKITDINDRALLMLGYSRDELIGGWLPDRLPIKDIKGQSISPEERTVSKALLKGEAVTEMVSYTRSDGIIIPVSVTASPLMKNNSPIGAVVVFRDFTHEAQVDKAKNEFVSLASHQLRTPLTAIKMYTEILKDPKSGKLTSQQTKYLERIETATNKMIELVSDFLNISKLELGKFEIRPKPTDIPRLLETHLTEIAAIAAEKSIDIRYTKSKTVLKANIDPPLISQVIHNLLTNALRYTSSKKGWIEVAVNKQDNDIVVSVADNGIGIPEDVQGRIFERFFRAGNATEVQPDGTGLGLYLAKRIAESSGGKLWFSSQNGVGTTFYLSLPLK